MKAYVIKRYGKNPLELVDVPLPTVGDKDLLVEIRAASINPVDFKIRDGKLKVLLNYDMPLIMGNDFAGVVTKVGSQTTRFKVGDEVYARAPENRIGSFAEFIAIDEDAVALKPQKLSFNEAASIPLVGLTSYQAMYDVLKLKPGQKILIHAGSGGVGTFAIQLAKSIGAFVATTTSESGQQLVKSLGADKVINYKKENFEEVLSDFDAVFDTLGGDSLKKSFTILKRGGEIVSVSGVPNARFANEQGFGILKTMIFSLISLGLRKLENKFGVRYTFLFMKSSGEQLRAITNLIDAGKVNPVIDQVFPFNEVQSAIEYSEQGRAKGKIIVIVKS